MARIELSPTSLRESLDAIEVDGWECPAGRSLLHDVREVIVRPSVRRFGLTGPNADQAVASAWAAAWDVLRRPSVRRAENPAGMLWVAVRRAVCAEFRDHLSLEGLLEVGWQPASPGMPLAARGSILEPICLLLEGAGWDGPLVADAVALLADTSSPRAEGAAGARWRWVALRLGIPEWQVSRLCALLLGGPGWAGIVERVARDGLGVLDDPGVRAAVRCTAVRWMEGPRAQLAASAVGLHSAPCAIAEGSDSGRVA